MIRLSALDASFLEFEDAVTHMHIGSIALFEGPPPTQESLCADVLAKLALVPRYRQLVRFVPLRAGLPVWVDDPHFNLDYHLRRTALPRPGGEQQLRLLVGRVMSQQLDRSKPLWEMWIAEGLEDDRWALVSKVHHCMVDGVAGSDLLTVLLDRERDPTPTASRPWTPKAAPDGLALLAQALVGDVLVGYAGARAPAYPTRTSPTSACASSAKPSGAAFGVQGRLAVGVGSRSRSSSTVSRSLPATPSTMQWCTLETSAQRSSSSPSAIHISHNGLERSSCWDITRPTSRRSCCSPPGRGSAVRRR